MRSAASSDTLSLDSKRDAAFSRGCCFHFESAIYVKIVGGGIRITPKYDPVLWELHGVCHAAEKELTFFLDIQYGRNRRLGKEIRRDRSPESTILLFKSTPPSLRLSAPDSVAALKASAGPPRPAHTRTDAHDRPAPRTRHRRSEYRSWLQSLVKPSFSDP